MPKINPKAWTPEKVKAKLPPYKVDDLYLRINDSRFFLTHITSIGVSAKYYMGLDNDPGIDEWSLTINDNKINLNITSRDEIKNDYAIVKTCLEAWVEQIKLDIKW